MAFLVWIEFFSLEFVRTVVAGQWKPLNVITLAFVITSTEWLQHPMVYLVNISNEGLWKVIAIDGWYNITRDYNQRFSPYMKNSLVVLMYSQILLYLSKICSSSLLFLLFVPFALFTKYRCKCNYLLTQKNIFVVLRI